MASACRKRKQPSGEVPPLAGEALARAILALPPQPQPICCRVAGCQQPLAPGYHKKYRICLPHSTSDQLCIEGKTCRWCQQCGRFHGLEVFDAKYRSCRYSLARHQERRKRRHAVVSAAFKRSKLARPPQEQQSLPDKQDSQLSGTGSEAQPQPQPLPLPQAEQAAAPKAAKPAKQQRRRQGGSRAKRAPALPAASASEAQLPAEQTPLAEQTPPPEQRLSESHSGKRPRQSPPPAASPEQPQQSDPAQPVTPPSLLGSHVARSLPMAEANPMRTMPSYAAPAVPAPTPALPPQRSLWPQLQQAAAAPADAAWAQAATLVAAAPATAAWAQPLLAAPTTPAWSQQPSDCSWLLIIGDQRLAPPQPPLPPQAVLPAAACEVQQPAGPVFWPAQQAQHVRSGSGGCSTGATYYTCYEPAAVQELAAARIPVAVEQLPCSPVVEAAACSTSTPAAPLSPRMAGAAAPTSLPQRGSATGSAYTTAAGPLIPTYGCCAGAAQASPYYAALSTGVPTGSSFWPGASLPAGPTPPAVPLPPEGYSGSSNALTQAWAQLAWQDEQMTPRAATTPCAAALQPSYLPSPRAELPFSLQPNQLPSLQPSQLPSLLPSTCAAPPPSPRAAFLQPSLPLSRFPSLSPMPPHVQSAVEPQQAQLWQVQQAQQAQQQPARPQRQQCWDMDWADDPLIASPLDCPPSPAISWLKDF